MTVTASHSAIVEAGIEAVAETLGAFDDLASWSRAVDHSSALTGGPLGVDSARRIQIGRIAIVERVVEWDLPRALAYRIEGLPKALGDVTNRWTLEPAGEGRSSITLTTTVDAAARVGGKVIEKAAAGRLAKTSERLVADLAAHLTKGVDR